MSRLEVFADPGLLSAITDSSLLRGTLRMSVVKNAIFISGASSQTGEALEGTDRPLPSWTADVNDRDERSWRWVKVTNATLDSLLAGNLRTADLDAAPVDGGGWPLDDQPVVALVDGLPVAITVQREEPERLGWRFVKRTGPASPFGSEPGFEAVDDPTCVMGAGAVGSHVAGMLPNWGLRRLLLVDRERLKRGNLPLHSCGPESIGQSKAEAVATQVRGRFSNVTAVGLKVDLLQAVDELRSLVAKSGLLVVALDDPVARQVCNHLAVSLGIPAVFVALFHRGNVTEVVAYRPGSACLNCVRLALPMEPQRNSIESPSSYRGGLRSDVQSAAAMAARTAAVLVHGPDGDRPELPGPVAYSSAVPMPDLERPWNFDVPGQTNWVPLPADPTCRVCRGGAPGNEKLLTAARGLLDLQE